MRPAITFCLLAAVPAAVDPAVADQFVLESGGRLQGVVVKDQRGDDQIQLKTFEGIKLTLARRQLTSSRKQRLCELEYLRRAPLVADTIQAQWRLAEWCRVNRLKSQREVHLRRILQLNPDHRKARHGLGYSFVQGQWRLPDQWQKADGYVRYKGRWRTAQEIELMQAHSQRDAAERAWLGRIKKLRGTLATARAHEALRQILEIRDPRAVRALRENLARESARPVKLLYIKTLGAIGNGDALTTLINTSLNDPDRYIFNACLDQILERRPAFAVEAYVKGLKDANNVRINRSAQALAELQAVEAIVPMIDALVTSHTRIQMCQSPNSLSTSVVSPANDAARAVSPSGGTSFSAGCRSRVIPVQVQNQAVLAALVRLTGASFGFNERAWTNWYAVTRPRAPQIDARRTQ